MRISDWSSDVCSSDLDDEGGAVRGADRPERFGQPRRFMLVDALDPKLKGRDRRGRQRLFEPRGKIAADIERGNQVKLAIGRGHGGRSEEHTSELQSLMRISYAVFCLKKKKSQNNITHLTTTKQG